MKWRSLVAALCGAVTLGSQAASAPAPTPPAAAAQSPSTAGRALTREDLESFLDGYMPYAIRSGEVAGAVVVVVKDGQILLQKGYGVSDVKADAPVDPATTMFRIGSVSKLFTWTAVMQLVEQGKLDLDADVNQYLDFKIPPRDGKPVTLRNLMTHTAGFAETVKHLFPTEQRLLPLGKLMAQWTPNRIFPPNQTPAYSNYGASLAGYIVQRVSGEPFDDYVERHIFAPLQMTHSTFRQPLPASFKGHASQGYIQSSQDPKPYEIVGPAPAGSMAASGEDMAHFMIAHLQKGRFGDGRILQEATAQAMHAPQTPHTPTMEPMALGFYQESRNGHRVIAHGGDTISFHSDLHLLVDDNVGIFMSVNSMGKNGAAGPIRSLLYQNFMDRYFPGPAPKALPTVATAKAHAAVVAGSYWPSRRVDSGFLKFGNLFSQMQIKANPDGSIVVPVLRDGGRPIVWHETGDFVWSNARGDKQFGARVENGEVLQVGPSDEPSIVVYQPVPAPFQASWSVPLLLASIAILFGAVVMWPVQAMVRARYGQRFAPKGIDANLYRSVRIGALASLICLGGFMWIIANETKNLALFDDPLDGWLRVLQLFGVIGVAAAVLAVWNALRALGDRSRSWWSKLFSAHLALALIAFAWFAFAYQLISLSLNY